MRSPRLVAAGAGLTAGFAGGLLGIGGGLIMVPGLTLLLGVPLKRAIGTSLFGVVVIAFVAVVTELLVMPANVHFAAAGLLAVGAIAGSWLGSRIIARTPTSTLRFLLAAMLVVASLKMAGVFALLESDMTIAPVDAAGGAYTVLRHVIGGVAAGVISAMFGVGGGILAVPLLAFLHPTWAFQACRATSLAMIVPTALAGALFHRKLEQVDWRLALTLAPGSLVGTVAGVVLANRVPGRPLEFAFGALLIAFAVRLMRTPGATASETGRVVRPNERTEP